MAIILTKTVKFDDVDCTVKLKFHHWLPRTIKMGGTTIGRSALFPRVPEQTHLLIIAHELLHVHDFVKKSKKIPGKYAVDVAGDLLHYLWQWIVSGFRYRKIREEVYAYNNEYKVLLGEYPGISAPWLTDRYKQGFTALAQIPGVTVGK
jgi:hypothetical protein